MRKQKIKAAITMVGMTTLLSSLFGQSPAKPPVNKIDTEIKEPNKELVEEEKEEKKITCTGCTEEEQIVIDFLVEQGITDLNAIATVLGNIKQESRFDTEVCEGGARTGYHRCYRGGFGLIQWTTHGRYSGLGRFANQQGLDPNHLETQLRYMVTEREWKGIIESLKTPGKSIASYMNSAYYWLGWGHHGARTHYSHDYASRLTHQ